MALMEYYCMPADFNVSILEEDELYDDHAQLWDELSEMLGGEASETKRVRCCVFAGAYSTATIHVIERLGGGGGWMGGEGVFKEPG